MTLLEAPFRRPLKLLEISGFAAEAEILQVLAQLGLEPGEVVEKMHVAPLRDPLGLRIGEQVFTLRSDICCRILVEVL